MKTEGFSLHYMGVITLMGWNPNDYKVVLLIVENKKR
jgi:hypothetical protein